MYTATLTLLTLIAIFSALAIVMEKVLDRLVFEQIEEDETDAYFEME